MSEKQENTEEAGEMYALIEASKKDNMNVNIARLVGPVGEYDTAKVEYQSLYDGRAKIGIKKVLLVGTKENIEAALKAMQGIAAGYLSAANAIDEEYLAVKAQAKAKRDALRADILAQAGASVAAISPSLVGNSNYPDELKMGGGYQVAAADPGDEEGQKNEEENEDA